MLLEFRVENFRSFKDEAVLSMAASPDRTLVATHTQEAGLEKIRRVLNSAAIYGANASGKSNLIRALHFMQLMVLTSNQIQPNQENTLAPFRLRPNFDTQQTRFECTLLIDGRRFQYGFEMTKQQVMNEWLLVYEKTKPQIWFSRTFDSVKDKFVYTYSDYFTGPKKLWESATRKEVLFLTTAVQLNNEQLKPLYQKFSEDLVFFLDGGSIGFDFSSQFVQDIENQKRLISFLRSADTGISTISFKKLPAKQFQLRLNNEFQDVVSDIQDAEMNIPEFGHLSHGKSYKLEFGDESVGTQILFSLSGPIFDILNKGRVLIVDELDRSLHPLLVHKLVQMFHDPELNSNGAQLIFSTHDVSLLDSSKMRRDQIWFAEKNNDQESHLFPLLDFAPRKGEALERGYLGGRYGGIPIIH